MCETNFNTNCHAIYLRRKEKFYDSGTNKTAVGFKGCICLTLYSTNLIISGASKHVSLPNKN
jgi:hypothetical protein